MYAPGGRREVHLLCFDRQKRLALERRPGARPRLPMAVCNVGEPHSSAVRRIASEAALRFGAVVGRLDVPPCGESPRREVLLFTGHAQGPASAWSWTPWRDGVRQVTSLGTPELADFVQGYLEGWIPDGWISLTAGPPC